MKMYFDFRDIFKALRVAFSFQRIWTNTLGLLMAYGVYVIFAYISLLISGMSLGVAIEQFGILPVLIGESFPIISWIFFGIGVLAAGVLLLVTNTAIARLVYMHLRNEFFYTWRQAFRFAFKKILSIIGAYLTFLFMIAFFVIGALVMGLIGRIPAIGEWLNALLTIPYIFAGMLLAFIVLVALVSIYIIPAILATMDEDALGGVFHSFSIVYNQPWRFAIYSWLAGILEIIGFAMYAFFIKVGYVVFATLFNIGMGEKFYRISETALAWLQNLVAPFHPAIMGFWGQFSKIIYFSHPHAVQSLSGVETIAAVMMTLFLFLMGVSVWGYAEATGNAGVTLSFLVLYKKQEDENLLEREDEELKEEDEEEEAEKEEEKAEGDEDTSEPSTPDDAQEGSSEAENNSEK